MKQLLCSVLAFGLVTAVSPAAVCATEGTEPPAAYYEAVQTDALANWPQGPAIYAESGILVDLDTQEILYSKNIDKQLYPASITKVMTTLVAIESSSPEEPVTFSQHALDSIEWDSSNIGCRLNETLTMEQCWYAMMLNSANEVCCGVAEHISGSIEAFVEKMNQKAAELGCTNTHFTNPHGLNDPEHYTTPKDMALIARAAFQNEVVRTVASTRTYSLPATKKNPSGLTVTMGHKMLNPNDSRYYEGIIGGKTGYTSKAGNTLVTAAERNGVRMIAVVMKSRSTHYVDTKAMLDYGFELAKAGALETNQTGGQNAGSSQTGAGSGGPGAGAGPSGAAGAPESTGASGVTVVPGNTGAPQNPGSTGVPVTGTEGGPGVSSQHGWAKTEKGWNFVKDNGAKASGEWVSDAEGTYWIDEDTFMAKGWRQIDGKWYYLRSNGAMAKNYWEESQDGVWYYLGADGVMMTNATTPDGYRVGADGAWIR